MTPPTSNDILAAQELVRHYLPKTPLVAMTKLSQLIGLEYYENFLPTNSRIVRRRQYHRDNNELVELSVLRYKAPWRSNWL
jgi:hypothetical protein